MWNGIGWFVPMKVLGGKLFEELVVIGKVFFGGHLRGQFLAEAWVSAQ
jgi:hypothetical protein